MARYLSGTIAQLAGKVSMGGKVLTKQQLHILSQLMDGTAFRKVGQIRRADRSGRPAIIWQVDTRTSAFIELENRKGGLVLSNTVSKKLKAA